MPRTDVRSLRARLTLALIAPLAVLFALGGGASYAVAHYFADSVFDGWLFDSVNSLALEVDKSDDGPSVDMPPSTQRLFEWDATDKTYFKISGAKRGLIVGRSDIPPAQGDIDEYQGAHIYDGVMDGQEVRIAALELPESEYGETVLLEVAETTRKRGDLARAILISTLIPQVLLIAVAAAAVRRAIQHGLTPLRTIAQRLEARSHRQLSAIPDQGVPQEVRPLTRSVNDLLERLESAITAQRRFIAQAAHQLRTPLTAIKLQAEEIRRENTHAELRPSLDALKISTDRAVRLSNQLLSLARAEPDSSGVRSFERIDLLSLVRDTGAEWAPRAYARGLDMQFAADADDQPVWIDGDGDLLREAIGNLIDNAIKYHSPPGTIYLRLVLGNGIDVLVEDDGPGVPAALRDKVMQRFVRGDSGEGSGLGLAIAQEIVRLHGGELFLEDRFGGRGLSARMRLQSAPDQA
ncbi:sensor histidine kinase [soil metagenome]